MPQYEMRGRQDFAEIAEVLGVPTSLMMAVRWDDEQLQQCVVLWSADDLEEQTLESPVKAGTLRRDRDGVLRLVHLPKVIGKVADFMPPRSVIEERLGEQLGLLMLDPAYQHELERMAEIAGQFVVCHEARTQHEGGDLDPELLLLGMMVGQAANIYNLSPPGGLIDPGELFTGGPPDA